MASLLLPQPGVVGLHRSTTALRCHSAIPCRAAPHPSLLLRRQQQKLRQFNWEPHTTVVCAAAAAGGSPGYASFHSSSGGSASFRSSSSSSKQTAATGAGPGPSSSDSTGAAKPAAAAKPASKARLPSLDSLRFWLIAYIGVGHFIAFATKDAFILKLFTQVNVWVGAFFVLSGYVAGYTATEVGAYTANPRIKPEAAYTISRVAGFYPLFILVQLLFAPMFVFADAYYNGPLATALHGFMSAGLVQAWFPGHAEVWNAPTWFLSALAFALIVLPHVLPAIAAMRKKGLRTLLLVLTLVSLLPKLAYSYDLGCWSILEGMCGARSHPNLMVFNIVRFNPFFCLLEVLMGVAAARLVMVQDVDDDGKPATTPPPPAGSALLQVLGLLGVTAARAAGWLPLNDPLTRGLLFVPLFIALVMTLHRQTLAGTKGLASLLGHPFLVYLGTISFPIFVLHGAIGQLFYKKLIATRLWGAVQPLGFFPAYCAVVLLAAAGVQKLFLENKKVQEVSGKITKAITAAVS